MGNDRTVKMPGAGKRRIPVGKAVYPALRRGDYVYVDKDQFYSFVGSVGFDVYRAAAPAPFRQILFYVDARVSAAVEAKLDDACQQSAAYASAENVRTLPNLKKAAVVFVGPTVKGVRYV